jgi:hypothetical protein
VLVCTITLYFERQNSLRILKELFFGGMSMPRCICCNDFFKSTPDVCSEICPKCKEYEELQSKVTCFGCNESFDSVEIFNGLCPHCRVYENPYNFENDSNLEKADYNEYELVSYDELESDVLEDDYDN